MKDIENYSLLNHNTFGIDVRCRRFLEYTSVDEAQLVARLLRDDSAPRLIVGAGSNLLLTRDFDGTVVHSALTGVTVEGDTVRCGSGTAWDDVVALTLDAGLYGAENLSLIPGDVGASAVQNIGAYGAEVRELISSVEAVDIETGERCVMSNADCRYGYRDSRFKHEWRNRFLITHVTYRLSTDYRPRLDYGNIRAELADRGVSEPTARQLRDVIIHIRRQKLPDPAVTGNAGSFFMNPVVARSHYERLAARHPGMPHYPVDVDHEKIPAGWLIEQCGWRGRSLGRAGVHDRQALVLVNRGGATGDDVLALCRAIQRDVRQQFDIDIHPEVNIV